MCFVCVSVRKVVVIKVPGDGRSSSAKAKGDVGCRDSFGCCEYIWLYTPVVDCKPLPCASPSAHDLVYDEKDIVGAAYLAETRHVFFGRNQHSVCPDDRLHKDRGNVALVFDHVLDVLCAGNLTLWVMMIERTVVAAYLRSEDDSGDFPCWLHSPSAGITCGRNRTHR